MGAGWSQREVLEPVDFEPPMPHELEAKLRAAEQKVGPHWSARDILNNPRNPSRDKPDSSQGKEVCVFDALVPS